jgi:hypothetical protein
MTSTIYPRQAYVFWPEGYWHYIPDPRRFHYTPPFEMESLYEVASDLVLKNTRDSWNKFEHYKRTNWFNTDTTTNGTYLLLASAAYYDRIDCVPCCALYEETAFGPRACPTVGLPALLKNDSTGLISSPATLDTLVTQSLRTMLPGIKPQLSLVNSLIELKDFKTLPRTIKRLASMFKSNKTLRRIMGGTADAYLQKEFNVMPLLSDIAGIRRALINTSKQIRNLLNLEGKLLTRHYYCGLESLYPNKAQTPSSTYGSTVKLSGTFIGDPAGLPSGPCLNGVFKAYRTVTYDKAQFHGEIQYSYYLTQFQRENAAILGLADSLGVNLNPAIIWNAIPWSFVVDWVLDVSRWLDQFKVRNLEPVTVIHRYMWSTTVNRLTKIDVESNLGITTLPKPLVRASYCRESAYKRDSYPIGLGHITTSGFSLKEFTLAGALRVSRVH